MGLCWVERKDERNSVVWSIGDLLFEGGGPPEENNDLEGRVLYSTSTGT